MTKTLLVVDDDPAALAVAARILRHDGYEVLEASSGEEAMAVAAERPPIDLLVTDYHMEGIDGDELADRLRRRHPELKVLIVSGSWPAGDDRFPVLQKPYHAQQLLDAVRGLLEGGSSVA